MLDSFIPIELAVAPNPLGLPSNLKLMTIPIDAHTCFELWQPQADGLLLPEEAMLLRGDRERLEEICAKLTDLLGATLNRDHALHDQPIDRWQTVRRALAEAGDTFEAICVAYLPQSLHPSLISHDGLNAWTLQQAQWVISFLTLEPLTLGFRAQALPIQVTIACGQSITRLVQTAPVLMHHA